MDQTEQAKETHRMEIVNDIYKKLHDLDYFLLRYGPNVSVRKKNHWELN